jgi:hypothetical protein
MREPVVGVQVAGLERPTLRGQTGSVAAMPGRDVCSGAALKALSISHNPTRLTPIRE